MVIEVEVLSVPDLFKKHGIHSAKELVIAANMTSQQAWNILSGYKKIGRNLAETLAERLGIPFVEIMAAVPVAHARRKDKKLDDE